MAPRPIVVLGLAAALSVPMALSVSAPAAAVAAPAVSAPVSVPQVMGGQPAPGFPGVVAIAPFDGKRWTLCTAALVRPRVLLTAAHCVTKAGTNEPVAKVRVFRPGARAVVFANTGPKGAAKVRVLTVYRGDADRVRTSTVGPNDVAALVLGADLGPAAFTRLATQAELARWRDQTAAVTHVGYGGDGTRRYSRLPNSVDLPFRRLSLRGSLGPTFSTATSTAQSVCPGDSGSPAYRTEPYGTILIGSMAGSTGACTTTGAAPDDLGFVGVGYLGLINAALADVGALTIPSAPALSAARARNRDVTVTWQAPQESPQTVVGYDVLAPDLTVVCQTTELSCTLPGLPDGSYAYTVRSRNAENEGDAVPAGVTAVVASPPQPAAPTVVSVSRGRYRIQVSTIAGRTSAVVTSYVVSDQNGQVVCTIAPPTQEATALECPGPTRRGTYTVTVRAETEMGPSPTSPPSVKFSVR